MKPHETSPPCRNQRSRHADHWHPACRTACHTRRRTARYTRNRTALHTRRNTPLWPRQARFGMSTKGQLTATIIVAILLVVVLGGLLYQATLFIKERTRKQIEAQAMTQAKITPVHDYIQACLDLASKDAFLTLGQQGGYLFRGAGGTITEGQGGLAIDFYPSEAGTRYMIDPDDSKKIIPYVIFRRESSDANNWLFSDPPQYPYATFPMWRLEDDASKSQDKTPYDGRYHYDGIFGANLLPRLYGPQPLPDFLDPNKLKEPIPSITNQVESYIANHTLSCIDFSAFSHANLEFSASTANVSVIFLNGTTIHLLYPVLMTDRITHAQGQLSEWITALPLRFSYFHQVLDFAVSRESDTLLFFMSNLTTPDGSITPIMRKNIKAGNDYIITYTDSQSFIDGRHYQFRFGVHDRPPTLYYINRTVKGEVFDTATRPGPAMDFKLSDMTGLPPSSAPFTICASKTKDGTSIPATITITNRGQGDIIEIQNARVSNPSPQCPQANLRLPLFALDPDEDAPSFTLSHLGRDGKRFIIDWNEAELLEQSNHEKLKLLVKASDGTFTDSQELLFPTHFEPPPPT